MADLRPVQIRKWRIATRVFGYKFRALLMKKGPEWGLENRTRREGRVNAPSARGGDAGSAQTARLRRRATKPIAARPLSSSA